MEDAADRIHAESDLPPSAVPLLRRLCTLLRNTLTDIRAAVLHGSAASSGFEPARSDLDVLVIVDETPKYDDLAGLASGLLHLSNQPHPIEFSIIAQQALTDWVHPCPHLFHFGEELRGQFEAGHILPQSPADADLAMHLTVARARGIDLLGRLPTSELPEIPQRDYLAAIRADFEWAQRQPGGMVDYMQANACRTLAYLTDAVVLSKSEGRQWCADRNLQPERVLATVLQELGKHEYL